MPDEKEYKELKEKYKKLLKLAFAVLENNEELKEFLEEELRGGTVKGRPDCPL